MVSAENLENFRVNDLKFLCTISSTILQRSKDRINLRCQITYRETAEKHNKIPYSSSQQYVFIYCFY